MAEDLSFMKIIIIILLIINIFGFVLCFVDKQKSKKAKWRIPEKSIFLTALLGGAFGVYISLILFCHKTLKKSFMWGIPAIMIAQMIVFLSLINKYLR